MLQEIIYSINLNLNQILIFFATILFIGILMIILMQKFDIHKKRMMYIGLFTGMKNNQIIALSAIFIRLFSIIYLACVYTENIQLSLAIILVADIIYIVLNPRKIIIESINIIAQSALLYLINRLKEYQMVEGAQMHIEQIIIILTIFIIIYAIYFFLKGVEDIIKKKEKIKKESKNGKKQ